MKNIIITLLIAFVSLPLLAQQDQQYTQFMFNKMGLNPAYAGANDAPCISAIFRNQWLSVNGAPQTQLLTFNMPIRNKRIGIGASLVRNTIGITENYTAEAAYAYRLRLGRGYLRLGLQGSVRLLRNDFSEVESTQPKETDGAIPVGLQSKFVPNFGAGAYYSSGSFYIGLSIPRLLTNSIDLADSGMEISREVNHVYAMGGVLLGLGENLQLQPQILLKYVKGAPFDADVNINFIFMDKFTTGVSYRLGGSRITSAGESISLLLAAQVTESLLFGLSYDTNLSEFRNYNNGSVEAALRYCIGGKSEGEEFTNPRFF